MFREAIELVFTLDGISADVAWRNIFNSHFVANDVDLSLYERPLKASAVSATLARSGKNHFDLQGDRFAFRFCPVAQFNHSVLEIRCDFAPSITECESWIKMFAMPTLISGRRFDVEYEHWQNAEDPIEYTTQGRSYAELTTIRDPMFGDERIDISSFPGRRVLRDGFVEAVGSTMWLAPEFEKRTGAKLEALKSQAWCHCTPVSERVCRIEIMDKCFTSAKGIERELQERLRAALFACSLLHA